MGPTCQGRRPPRAETLARRRRAAAAVSFRFGRLLPSPVKLVEGKRSPGAPLPFSLWNHRLNRFGKRRIRVRLGFVYADLSFLVAGRRGPPPSPPSPFKRIPVLFSTRRHPRLRLSSPEEL